MPALLSLGGPKDIVEKLQSMDDISLSPVVHSPVPSATHSKHLQPMVNY